ncbi:MAG: hypothetical protein H7A39_04185 [Chlamydiales bacterium]|nr:hypothetical protein [Chlamydiales bacterium]
MVPKVSTLSAKLPGNISPKYLGITLLAVCALATGVGLFFAGRKLLVNKHAVALKKLKLEVSAFTATKNCKFSEFDYDGIVRKYTTSETGALSEREAKEAILSTFVTNAVQFGENFDEKDFDKFCNLAKSDVDEKSSLLVAGCLSIVQSKVEGEKDADEKILKWIGELLTSDELLDDGNDDTEFQSKKAHHYAVGLVAGYFKPDCGESISPQKFNWLKDSTKSCLSKQYHCPSNVLISVLCQIDRFQAFYEGLSDDEKGKCIQAAYQEIHSEIINATRGPTRIDVVKRIKNKP